MTLLYSLDMFYRELKIKERFPALPERPEGGNPGSLRSQKGSLYTLMVGVRRRCCTSTLKQQRKEGKRYFIGCYSLSIRQNFFRRVARSWIILILSLTGMYSST